MSKQNALVKKLQAVEALGQASIIAVDKTGTITENKLKVSDIYSDDIKKTMFYAALASTSKAKLATSSKAKLAKS